MRLIEFKGERVIVGSDGQPPIFDANIGPGLSLEIGAIRSPLVIRIIPTPAASEPAGSGAAAGAPVAVPPSSASAPSSSFAPPLRPPLLAPTLE